MKNQPKPKVAIKTTKVAVKPKQKMVVKTTKVVVKPKATTKSQEPTYKNLRMGVNNDNRSMGQMLETKPTKSDSASYKFGYKLGLAGKGASPAKTNTVKMGRWEGQNVKNKKK